MQRMNYQQIFIKIYKKILALKLKKNNYAKKYESSN